MVVYMDLVFVLNFLVDYFLLLGTNRLGGYPPGYGRSALAAVLGGIYAASCMIPEFQFLSSLLWRTVSFAMIAMIAFGWNRSALQRGAVFLLLAMAMGGLSVGSRMYSFWTILLCAALVWGLCRVCFRNGVGQREYATVVLPWNGRKLSLIALKDTGNLLKDPITGEQILVAGADVAMDLLGLTQNQLNNPVETMAENVLPGMRLIPYHGVGQSGGLMLALRFYGAKIGNTYADPLVAFAPQTIARGEVYRMLTGGTV